MQTEKVIVVGGGAAGLMAAGRAAEKGARVILLEKNRTIGRKIGIAGKGRCNVTNVRPIKEFIDNYPVNGRFLYSAFNRFSNDDLYAFLEAHGVKLKVERGGRVFPVSDRAADVVECFEKYLEKAGVKVLTERKVEGILQSGGVVRGVLCEGVELRGDRVIVATGGKSYPKTGSTGDGYAWAKEMGHTIIPLRPALVPLNIKEEWVKELQGLSLKNISATVFYNGKLLGSEFGELLFTHFGVSGPVILTLSGEVAKISKAGRDKGELLLVINLKPALSAEQLERRVRRDLEKYRKRQLKNALDDLLPQRLISPLISLSGIDPEKPVAHINRAEIDSLCKTLAAMSMTIEGPRPLSEAIVTAGGIALNEINPQTMESKIISGLYFVGEVLNIDGYTGGYNLQAAFSMGYAAGEHVAETLLSNQG